MHACDCAEAVTVRGPPGVCAWPARWKVRAAKWWRRCGYVVLSVRVRVLRWSVAIVSVSLFKIMPCYIPGASVPLHSNQFERVIYAFKIYLFKHQTIDWHCRCRATPGAHEHQPQAPHRRATPAPWTLPALWPCIQCRSMTTQSLCYRTGAVPYSSCLCIYLTTRGSACRRTRSSLARAGTVSWESSARSVSERTPALTSVSMIGSAISLV